MPKRRHAKMTKLQLPVRPLVSPCRSSPLLLKSLGRPSVSLLTFFIHTLALLRSSTALYSASCFLVGIPFFLPYFSGLYVFFFAASIGEPLCALLSLVYLLFVLCLRVSCSCYVLLAVYSRYCFAYDGVSSRGAVGIWDKFGPSRNLQRLSMMNLSAYPQFPTWLAAEFGVQLIRAELQSNAYPRLPGSSESHRQFDSIRAELPSNG